MIDLHSSHGTFVNGERLEAGKPHLLGGDDVVHFGISSRRYQLVKDDVRPAVPKKRKRDGEGEENGGEAGEASVAAAAATASAEAEVGEPARKKRAGPSSVRCRHLLVKHAESRRPSSWKQKVITRSPEEALDMIHAFRAQVLESVESGVPMEKAFAKLAHKESDCSSAKRGGDLGRFERGRMQPTFEAAAFALEVGEMSEPVHSNSGIHIILRTE